MKNFAIILAAGIGSRLYPLTENYPKSLVKVNGREILDYQIQGYLKSGIQEENIYIVTGYKHEMIVEFLNKKYPRVKEIYSADYLTTNNMYSLYLALKQLFPLFDNIDSVFINNADCLYGETLMQEFVNSEYCNAIAVEEGVYIEESMKVIQRGDKTLKNIAKTILPNESFGVSVDLYKYSGQASKKLFEIITDYIEIKKDLKQWTEVAFPALFELVKVYPFDIKHKKWVEVDNNDDLAMADKLFSTLNMKEKKALICDMDGTLYVGKTPIQKAIEFVKDNKNLEIYFLTNNTSKIPYDYINRLNSFGINVDAEHILTPLKVLVNYLKNKEYKSVYLIANAKVLEYTKSELPSIDFSFNKEKNEAVVLTYDTEIDFQKLKNICDLLNNKNIEYIATHSDVFCPSEIGSIPDIGSFIKLIEATCGKTPDVILGKPNMNIVKEILDKFNAKEIVIAGDRLYTDKLLADNMKSDFVCVLSGETTRLDVQKYSGLYPAIVVKNLGEI